MGVRGLTKLLKRYAPSSVKTVPANQFANHTIAIDASCHLNRFMYGDGGDPNRHIQGFYLLARFCELNNIHPVFVFDGPRRLAAKQLEQAKRAQARKKVERSLRAEQKLSSRLKSLDTAVFDDLVLAEQMRKRTTAKIRALENRAKYTRPVLEHLTAEQELMEALMGGVDNAQARLMELQSINDAMVSSLERRSIRITYRLRRQCKKFLEALGYVTLICEDHEAEAMCAQLAWHGVTSATVSDDMDTIVFGDAPILRYFFVPNRTILKIDPVAARQELGLSRESFIDLCILCGTDFSGTIRFLGPITALGLIQKHGSIENVLQHLPKRCEPQESFDYQLARHTFTHLPELPLLNETTSQDTQVIQELLAQYEINPGQAEEKAQAFVFQQNPDTNVFGSNPFPTSTTHFL